VELLTNGESEDRTQEISKETDWKYNFTDLAKYDKQGEEIEYTIQEIEIPAGYEAVVDGYNITNTQKSTEVSGKKTWKDDNNPDRPKEITVQLLANNSPIDSKIVTDESDWQYTFTKLPKYDKKGKEITYTVDEKHVAGYSKAIDGNDLINTRTGTTEVTVDKTWIDENKTDRPESITVNLLKNGTVFKTEEIKADEDGNWSHTFEKLPEFDETGKAYEYTVTEQDVPGYDSKVDGFEITNTRADEKSIEITKAWLDDNSEKRPDSIEVELFRSIADGE